LASINTIIVEEDIYDLLYTEGILSGWNAFIGRMPDSDTDELNNCISINSYSGYSVQSNFIQRPNFQILIRHESYETGRAKTQKILDFLMNYGECLQYEFSINGHHYPLLIPMMTVPEDLGVDERNRQIFSINFSSVAEEDDNTVLDVNGEFVLDSNGEVIYDTISEAIDG